MDWMRRKRNAALMMVSIATLSAQYACSSVNKQMPPQLRRNPEVLAIERDMLDQAKKGDIGAVESGLKKIKKKCDESSCTIEFSEPEVFVADLESLMRLVDRYEEGKLSKRLLQLKIRKLKTKHKGNKEAIEEIEMIEGMLNK